MQTGISHRLGTDADLRIMIIVWRWIGSRKGPSLLKGTRRVLRVLHSLMALPKLPIRLVRGDDSALELVLTRRYIGLIFLEGSSYMQAD
jgi:hypothetical protein